MADTTNDIFAGLYVSMYYSNDTTNTDMADDAFLIITEPSAFPETGIERAVIDVPNFTNKTDRKLVGRASIPDITLSFNYIPGDPSHEALVALADSGERFQVKIVYWIDDAMDYGIGKIYNVFVSNSTLTGGSDAVVGYTLTLTVDQQMASGVVDTTATPPA